MTQNVVQQKAGGADIKISHNARSVSKKKMGGFLGLGIKTGAFMYLKNVKFIRVDRSNSQRTHLCIIQTCIPGGAQASGAGAGG